MGHWCHFALRVARAESMSGGAHATSCERRSRRVTRSDRGSGWLSGRVSVDGCDQLARRSRSSSSAAGKPSLARVSTCWDSADCRNSSTLSRETLSRSVWCCTFSIARAKSINTAGKSSAASPCIPISKHRRPMRLLTGIVAFTDLLSTRRHRHGRTRWLT